MYAIIDLETTGGRPETDRIIEIAIYTHDGVSVTGEYSSLVNPGVPIPPFISRLTGISEEMVSTAPPFAEIALAVKDFLGNRIFVAHNAPFDHSFLTAMFRNEGIEIDNKVLCTCTTSRKVIPGYPSYSLGKLCRSVGIRLENAHRAAADALATTRLLELLIQKSSNNLLPFLRDHNRANPLCNIPEPVLAALPESAGILFFKNNEGEILFLAKAWNIRKKARALTSKFGTGKLTALAALATTADAEVTGSRLAASIREYDLLDELRPAFNRRFRDGDSRMAIYDVPDKEGFINFEIRPLTGGLVPVLVCTSRTTALKSLKVICAQFSLDPARCGLSAMDQELAEPVAEYNSRAESALLQLHSQKKSFVIFDRGPSQGTEWVFMLEDSMFKGMRLMETELLVGETAQLEELVQLRSDKPAIVRQIARHIAKGDYRRLEPLHKTA